jgi:uncharacterized protein (TIGR02145 family)
MKRIVPILVFLVFGLATFYSCKKDPVAPTVTTSDVTNVTVTSATSGGIVTKDGGAGVSARGVCWGTSENPSVSDSHTSDANGVGSFVSELTDLTSNTLYHIRAYATNKAGTAYGTDISFTTTPIVVPTLTTTEVTSVTITTAISGGNITSDGNGTITERGVCWGTTSGPTTANSKATEGTGTGIFTINLTQLDPATTYYVRAYATNSAGIAYGNELSFVTVSLLGAPTNVTATKGNAQASVAFTAPVSNGGSAITGYTVTSTPGSFTATGITSPITVTGLTNGTAYTFTVVATNANGNSPASSPSNSVTPSAGPGAPTIGTATKGNAQASVTFTAPTDNGGSPITLYTVTSTPGGFTMTGTSSPIIVTGLTNGTAYTFTVSATNANGTSLASSASNSVTPSTVPFAPIIGTATKGNAQASVAFTAPANGGSAITGYTVTSTPGGFTMTGTSSPIVVTGLTNGTAYTFKVVATNANGPSVASAASNSVTPSAVPGAPTIGTATKGNAQASVTFTAPVSDGGSPITLYTVTSTPGGVTKTGTSSPIIVTGLTNGTAYTFIVVATNANGNSLASAASNSVTPSTVPGAPTIGTATEGDAQASVTFTAPVSNGGSAITGYTVTSTPGGITMTGGASPITVTGLTNGTAYTFTVVATNTTGSSLASSPSNSVRPHTATTIYDIDGNLYNLITINSQVWMAENLKTTKFSDGSNIPLVTDNTAWSTSVLPAYSWYANDIANKAANGALYNWYAVDAASNGNKNVCPALWHVPTDTELEDLKTFLGGETVAGGKLKEAGTTHWPVDNGTNDVGFTALPSGERVWNDGGFAQLGTNCYFWSSTIDEWDISLGFGQALYPATTTMSQLGFHKSSGASIRCIKD